MYHSDVFDFGVSYRSRIKVKLKGSATSAGVLQTFAVTKAPLLGLTVAQNSAASSEVTLPDMLNVGVSFSPAQDWRLSIDVDWVNWKTFDKLDIAFASAGYQKLLGSFGVAARGGNALQIIAAAPVSVKTVLENYKATTSLRVGLQWDYSSDMRARFGFAYDPSPVGDPSTFSPGIPDNGRYLFAVGYGYDFNQQTTLDLAYMYVYFKNRTQTASTGTNAVRNGSYKIAPAHLVSASLSHRF
jgi:long-chain fatty acid transport protein